MMSAMRCPRLFWLVLILGLGFIFLPGCSKSEKAATSAPAAAASAMATAAAEPAAAKSDDGKSKGGKDDKPGGAPKTWKRAGSATHAARIAIGDKEQLPVRGMQMRVHIDGFRARVILDAYFENDRSSQYEGT